MKRRRRGRILLVASLIGFLPVPHYAVYAATKAFVISLGESLHEELRPFGIDVSLLSPGMTETEFFKVSGAPHPKSIRPLMQRPEQVVKEGLAALDRKHAHRITGPHNRLAARVINIIPRSVMRRISGLVTRPNP